MFEPGAHEDRHFGLVVDDKEAARAVLAAEAVELLPTGRLDFRDPFGNRVQVVQYDEIQFLKASAVLRGMGLVSLAKTQAAIAELRSNGLA
jgi:lactoylglutathione lyase